MFRSSELILKILFTPVFFAIFLEITVAKTYRKISRDLIGSWKKRQSKRKEKQNGRRGEAKLVIFKGPEMF